MKPLGSDGSPLISRTGDDRQGEDDIGSERVALGGQVRSAPVSSSVRRDGPPRRRCSRCSSSVATASLATRPKTINGSRLGAMNSSAELRLAAHFLGAPAESAARARTAAATSCVAGGTTSANVFGGMTAAARSIKPSTVEVPSRFDQKVSTPWYAGRARPADADDEKVVVELFGRLRARPCAGQDPRRGSPAFTYRTPISASIGRSSCRSAGSPVNGSSTVSGL